ncbi:MAG: hypothetical protein ABSH46_19830 [Bryobacteraceae bacterium]|jgi:hypothetical protein
MLTVCFDAGGKEKDHRVLTVAGFASFAGVWAELEERWQKRLDRDGLGFFHAGDFAHSVGQFSGWKGDEKRRRSLLVDLFRIIQDCGLRKFGCILHLESFYKIKKKRSGEPRLGPYIQRLNAFAYAATMAVESFQSYAMAEGVRDNIRCVFEKGDPEDILRKIFRAKGLVEPDFMWSKPHTDGKGFSYDPFLGLQAAGWIAYEYYLDVERLLYSGASDRWALRQFEILPGQLTFLSAKDGKLLPYVGDLKIDSKRIAEAIALLERAANEGKRSREEN